MAEDDREAEKGMGRDGKNEASLDRVNGDNDVYCAPFPHTHAHRSRTDGGSIISVRDEARDGGKRHRIIRRVA